LSAAREKKITSCGREAGARGALGWIPGDAPADVAAARGFYLLRQWGAAEAAVAGAPELPGAGVILALARARMGEEARAEEAFAMAVAARPDDPYLRGAHAAFLLRARRGEEALAAAAAGLAILDQRPATNDRGRTGESALRVALLSASGGARWARGQALVGSGEDGRAVTEFEHAARAFLAAGRSMQDARDALPGRLAAAYVGQAVAMVAAGQYEAAPRLFVRRCAEGMAATPALSRFARDLYELCDLAARLPATERAAAGEAMRPVLAGARLTATLWDGGHPLVLGWHGWERTPGCAYALHLPWADERP